jgi:hypothetical protein
MHIQGKAQACLIQTSAYVENLAQANNLDYDYILLHSSYVGEEIRQSDTLHFGGWMQADLQTNHSYTNIYLDNLIAIYQRQGK